HSLWDLKQVKRARNRIITLRFTFRVTLMVTRSCWEHRGCAWRDIGFGHGQNTVLGWSDPTFGSQRLAKTSWGRSSPQTGNGSVCEVFCPCPGNRKKRKGGTTCRSSTSPRNT